MLEILDNIDSLPTKIYLQTYVKAVKVKDDKVIFYFENESYASRLNEPKSKEAILRAIGKTIGEDKTIAIDLYKETEEEKLEAIQKEKEIDINKILEMFDGTLMQ